MSSSADPPFTEQHDADEARFQEESGQRLIHEERAEHVRHRTREAGPVRSDLVAQHHTGDNAHAEGECEELEPEAHQVAIDRPAGAPPQAAQQRHEAGNADGEGRPQDMVADGEGELQSRENDGIHGQAASASEPAATIRIGTPLYEGVKLIGSWA